MSKTMLFRHDIEFSHSPNILNICANSNISENVLHSKTF